MARCVESLRRLNGTGDPPARRPLALHRDCGSGSGVGDSVDEECTEAAPPVVEAWHRGATPLTPGGTVDIGGLHVAAACAGLGVGLVVLLRGKGGTWHVALGRVFLASMVLVNVPVLLLYEDTGRPGPFHVLAVVSLVTTTLGWMSLRRRPRGRSATAAHASFMTWSWIGVATAGLAQLGNRQWPEQAPWPVVAVVGLATGIGSVWVPRYVSRQLTARPLQREGTEVDRRRALCRTSTG